MDTATLRSRATPWFVTCTIVAALYFARDFVAPIALAVYIAFVFVPLVRRLTRHRIPRVVATSIILGSATIALVAIGWLLAGQISSFADKLPEYRSNLREKIVDIRGAYSGSIQRATSTVRELGDQLTLEQADGTKVSAPTPAPVSTPASSSNLVQTLIGSLALFGSMAAFVFLLSWVMLLRWEDLRYRMLELAGRSDLYVTTRATVEASAKVTAYVRKQLLVNALHGTALSLLLWWVGVPNPLVWGILAAALRFVPYLGPIVSTVAPIVVSLASSNGWSQTWLTAGVLIGLEVVTNNVVEPLAYGSCTGISPLALLVSAAFWTWLWGPVGLVLSTPMTVCLLVVGKHFPRLHFFEVLMGDQPAMPESARLYHRLLADDQDEAWDIVRKHTAQASGSSAADQLLLPALALAGSAVRDGTIDMEQRNRIATIALAVVGEMEDAHAVDATPALPAAPRVLCIAARDAFDSVGNRLLAIELEQRGLQVTIPGEGELLGETLERIRKDPPNVVCISSVAPTHFLHVRTLCKRLLKAEPRVHIVLGLWGEDLEPSEIEQRLPASDKLHVAISLAGAVERTAGLAGHPVVTSAVRSAAI